MRPPLSLILAGLAVLLGMAGLVRGAMPQSTSGSIAETSSQSSPIVVSGAYVREPANDVNAAAYFSILNTGGVADTLLTVTSGASAQSSLHTEVGGTMTLDVGGLTIPAHGTVTLSRGQGHVMLEKLYGTLAAGQTVNLQLTFAQAGDVLVTAPVIAIAAPAPTAEAPK